MAYGKFLEVSRLSILILPVCFLVCAHLHRIPLLHGSFHPRTQDDLAVFSLSNTTSHLFSVQQHRSVSFHMFRPQMTLRERTRAPRLATVALLGPGEAKRDNVFLLPAGRGVTTTYACCACCVTLEAMYSSSNRMSFTLCMSAPTLRPTRVALFCRHMSSRFCRGGA
jgi:hypothetical protein